MRVFTRCMKWVGSLALACTLGSVPSCATMGGGGMKYLVDPASVAPAVV